MEHADDDNSLCQRPVIDGIRVTKDDTKTGAELFTRRRSQGKMPHGFKHSLNRSDEP